MVLVVGCEDGSLSIFKMAKWQKKKRKKDYLIKLFSKYSGNKKPPKDLDLNAVVAFDRMKDGAQFGKIIVKVRQD